MRELGITYTPAERERLGLPPRQPYLSDHGMISRASQPLDHRPHIATSAPANGGSPTPTTPLSSVVKDTELFGDGVRIGVMTPIGQFEIVITGGAGIADHGVEEADRHV